MIRVMGIALICFTSILVMLVGCKNHNSTTKKINGLFSYDADVETRWSSPENFNGIKGAGGKENDGAKGHPADSIAAGASYTLLDIKGTGIVNRMWVTISDRSPEMLRSLKIEMFWDNATKPAVSVPFGDFFGIGLGKTSAFQNALFANGEGRSFTCVIPMPFKDAAKIVVTNESSTRLNLIFFDVNYSLLKSWSDDYLYFHAFWHRDTATTLAKDFELLPQVNGNGRFLGVNIGVNGNPLYKGSWFGEGEVKIYLDGDKDYPTLNGTGTEDYIGTGWGQGRFINNYSGCIIADDSTLQWCFYRYHIPDPVFFKTDLRAVIQQLGGDGRNNVARFQRSGAPIIPISIADTHLLHTFYKKDSTVTIDTTRMPDGWTNFYRSDDVSATAYFYLDKPVSKLTALQPASMRAVNLRSKN